MQKRIDLVSSSVSGGSHVCLVAHDAGGARALMPVVEELRKREVLVHPLLTGPAVRVWEDNFPGFAFLDLCDETRQEDLESLMTDFQVGVLISASGLYNQIEHRARLAARKLGLPVVALMDSWFNYKERFQRTCGGNVQESRPDQICVIDTLTRDAMLEVGFSPKKILLTGHPGLERGVQQCAVISNEERLQLRKNIGITGEGLVITFFSDPFFIGPNRQYYSGPGAIMNKEGKGFFGYTVEDVLPIVLKELDRALHAESQNAELIVRPHPSEHPEVLREIIDANPVSRLRVRLESGGSAVDWIRLSNAVMGMMTIALLEAALAGKPSISVEFNLESSGEADPCMSNTLGYTFGVFNPLTFRHACEMLARQDWQSLRPTPRHYLPVEGAAARVADVLHETLRSH